MSKKIKVACCGVFDYVIHPGHIEFLNFAASLGDELCVFIATDEVIIENKKRKPVFQQNKRALNVKFINPHCNTILLPGGYHNDIMAIIKLLPSIYVYGPDQKSKWDQDLKKELIKNKITTTRASNEKRCSTTKLLFRDGLLDSLLIKN